jgi:hypothetical protein
MVPVTNTPEAFKNCLLSIDLSIECAYQAVKAKIREVSRPLAIPLACFFAK